MLPNAVHGRYKNIGSKKEETKSESPLGINTVAYFIAQENNLEMVSIEINILPLSVNCINPYFL